MCVDGNEIWKRKLKVFGSLGSVEVSLSGIGNPDLINLSLMGIFASVKCPGRLILKAHEEAKVISAQNQAVVGGFQSPVEKEILEVLLRGESPIIICLARGLNWMRIPIKWKRKLNDGQLLLLSSFPAYIKRTTAETILKRNQLVVDLASELLIVHAEPEGKVEKMVEEAILLNKKIRNISDVSENHESDN
jgi:predicted Rossmann fold nucleotide-binding protein DprA/Smf involved in DNA uptake